ncbi:hypothetical protein [Neptuniibacter halophilus]|uniref:hypothetical protein n=1 Tax=Neptuniibacter halophilus TaxID=651666 RepID=UPI0025726687|nr:hypothetical protein [Neptuniibacter halophilus]
MKNRLKRWFYQLTQNPRRNLAMLGIGFVVFFIGLILLGSAEFLLKSSVSQELLALLGLIILCAGLILAAIGYISLSILRIIRFISDDKHD